MKFGDTGKIGNRSEIDINTCSMTFLTSAFKNMKADLLLK